MCKNTIFTETVHFEDKKKRVEEPSLFQVAENSEPTHVPFLEAELDGSPNHPETVSATASEVDGGGFRKILRRTCNLTDVETGKDNLCKHLVVKHEIV